jgi:hypothetical protein
MHFSTPSSSFLPLIGLSIPINPLFTDTLGLCYSTNLREQVSHTLAHTLQPVKLYSCVQAVRYTNLKIYCDQTSSGITTQVVTERLLTLKVFPHLKPSIRGHHLLLRCGRPSKWRTVLTWKRRSVCCSSNKTISDVGSAVFFLRSIVNKHLLENPFASRTNNVLKLVAFVLRTISRVDDQVTRLCSMFVRRFSVVRRNPQGGQAGKWKIPVT